MAGSVKGIAATSKAMAAWSALGERQRALLRSAFAADQAAEAREQERQRLEKESARSLYPRGRPASEWRWLNRDAALGRLRRRDSDRADLAVLAERGLIETDAAARVRLTRPGRAAARAGTGASPPARQPRGLLGEWSWAALARLHAAGDGGLVLEARGPRAVASWERCPSWITVVRLRNRKDPYVEEVKIGDEWCVRLTPAGREHATANRERYQAAYPDVPVPGPGSPEALHRASPEQLRADAGHRRLLLELGDAAYQARISDDHDEARRLHDEADLLRQASGCGHWRGDRAVGASCRARH